MAFFSQWCTGKDISLTSERKVEMDRDLRTFYDTFGFLVYESTREWARTQNPFGPADRVYDPAFLAGGGPRRQSMVRQLNELGFK